MILDVLFFLISELVDLLSSVIPPLPESLSSLSANLQPRMVGLVDSLPYSHLFPWSTLSLAALVVPQVYGAAFAIRLVRRLFAWVRSRGNADE